MNKFLKKMQVKKPASILYAILYSLYPYYKYLLSVYKKTKAQWTRRSIMGYFRRNLWLFPVVAVSLALIGWRYLQGKKYECFNSYANNRMQGAIDILSVNTLEPIYRVGLIRDLYLFDNPAVRDAFEKQMDTEVNIDDIVNELKRIIQSDLNNINNIGSECEDCETKLRDALGTLNSSRLSSEDKLDILKKMRMYDPPEFTRILDISNYTDDSTLKSQLMDLIQYLRIDVSNPIRNIPESFSPIPVDSRPPYTTRAFESACEIINTNSLPPDLKLDKIKSLNLFENPDYSSIITNTEAITDRTVNDLYNIIGSNISSAPDEYSRTKMYYARKILSSGSLSPKEKIRVLNTMDIYNSEDYIEIMNPLNYSNDKSIQLNDLVAYLNCGDVERKRRSDEAAAAALAKKLADEAAAAALAKKLADEAAAAAQKAAEEAAAQKAAEEAAAKAEAQRIADAAAVKAEAQRIADAAAADAEAQRALDAAADASRKSQEFTDEASQKTAEDATNAANTSANKAKHAAKQK